MRQYLQSGTFSIAKCHRSLRITSESTNLICLLKSQQILLLVTSCCCCCMQEASSTCWLIVLKSFLRPGTFILSFFMPCASLIFEHFPFTFLSWKECFSFFVCVFWFLLGLFVCFWVLVLFACFCFKKNNNIFAAPFRCPFQGYIILRTKTGKEFCPAVISHFV